MSNWIRSNDFRGGFKSTFSMHKDNQGHLISKRNIGSQVLRINWPLLWRLLEHNGTNQSRHSFPHGEVPAVPD
jgi:hypothetical protein